MERRFYPQTLELIAKFFLVVGVFFIPIATAPMSVCLTIAFALVLLSGQWQAKLQFLRERPALWVPLLLFALILLSALHGVIPWSERFTVVRKYGQLLVIPFLAWLFTQDSTRQKALAAFLVAMLITWFLSYLLCYANIAFFPYHSTAVFHDHISISIFSAFSIFVFVYLANASRGRLRYFYVLMALLGTWYLFFINSGRSGYLVFAVLLPLSFYKLWRWKGLLTAGVLGVFLGASAYWLSPVFHAKTSVAAQGAQHYMAGHIASDDSIALRMISLKKGADLVKAHPFIGVGTGSEHQAAVALPWMTPALNIDPISNDWLSVSSETGILGFVLILLMYYVQWRQSVKLPGIYSPLAELVVATMLFSGIIGTPLLDAIEANFYGVFAALCFAAA